MNRTGPIVIIGGMGPQASAVIHQQIIERSALDFVAKHGTAFPELIVHSVPVPEFISDPSNMTKAYEVLKHAINRSKQYQPSIVIMACNTAHLLFNDLKQATGAPMVSLIDIMCKHVSTRDIKRLGLLASPTTLKTGLYQTALADSDVLVSNLSTSRNKIIEKVIRSTIGGHGTMMKTELDSLIAELLEDNQVVLLGCTELPLVFGNKPNERVISCNDILVDFVVGTYYKKSDIIGVEHE